MRATDGTVLCYAPWLLQFHSLFSLAMDKGYLGGYMAYFVFVYSAVMALCCCRETRSEKSRTSADRIAVSIVCIIF